VFRTLVDNLRYDDPLLVFADSAAWTRMSILNSARSGKLSSERAIAEYCDDIWNVSPVAVKR